MNLERQVLFWGLAVAALLLVIYLLGSIITQFAAGIVLGYLLDPIVQRLERLGLSRHDCVVGTVGAIFDIRDGIHTGPIAQ